MNPKTKSVAKETFETIFTALILALAIRAFIIQPFKIPTGSMEPTLMPKDRILVLRYIYGLRIPFTYKRIGKFIKPKSGDIIVFNFPQDPKRAFIKRCIATEGEEIQIKNGDILIDGEKISKSPINKIYYYNRGEYGQEDNVLAVPQDSYFVMGDNSASSEDSRYWGFLNDKYLIGKAIMVYWPPNRIRLLK